MGISNAATDGSSGRKALAIRLRIEIVATSQKIQTPITAKYKPKNLRIVNDSSKPDLPNLLPLGMIGIRGDLTGVKFKQVREPEAIRTVRQNQATR